MGSTIPYLRNPAPDGSRRDGHLPDGRLGPDAPGQGARSGRINRPIAFAHRGFNADGLENSAAGFAAAAELGYGWVETDAHTTADGVVIAFHDDGLDRVTDGHGDISGYTFTQLRGVLIGGRDPIPTLQELLVASPELRFNIDVKDAASAESVPRLIERLDVHDRVCIASFSDRRRRSALRRLSAPVASSAGRMSAAAFFVAARLGMPQLARPFLRDVHCLQLPLTYRSIRIITANFIARAHSVGLPVHVWTINDAAEMHRLLDLGVDGIMTDRADVLARVMDERKWWPQGRPTR